MNKTVIIGATPNPARYAFIAAEMLTDYGHEIVPVGIRKGEVCGSSIVDLRKKLPIEKVETITMYIGPKHQPEWYDYLISLKPKRIIFNPGTENEHLEKLASEHGIEAIQACTLVMLRTGQY